MTQTTKLLEWMNGIKNDTIELDSYKQLRDKREYLACLEGQLYVWKKIIINKSDIIKDEYPKSHSSFFFNNIDNEIDLIEKRIYYIKGQLIIFEKM